MKNVLVVYNVNAGRKQSIKYKKELQKFLLKNAECFKFISIDELNSTNTDIYDTVVAMGGDGTIHKVLPLVINQNKTLGIIPCGTANLLAEKLEIPTNYNKALKIFEQGVTQKIDVLKINDELSALRFGLGYDADIICKTPQSLKQNFGYFAYFIAGILFALRLKKKEYVITCKNEKQTVNASCIIVANAPNMYRNWVSVAKSSKVDDGIMEVFILKTTNPIIFFFELSKMVFKLHKTNRNAMYFKTDNLTIENKWFNSHIDGERKNFKENINIEIIPSSVPVFTSNRDKN